MYQIHRHVAHFSRREIDVAIGVLIGMRGCSEQQAFEQIAEVAHQTSAGLGGVSQALISVVSGRGDRADESTLLRRWHASIVERPSVRR